jgi:hypothetical protein
LQGVRRNIVLGRGIRIEHPECIVIGDNVFLNDYS